MKVFYVMGNTDFKPYRKVSWMDRRKGEIAMRFIGAGVSVPCDIERCFSDRLKKRDKG